MAIDFHAETNRRTYSGRAADDSWRDAIRRLVDPVNAVVVDVGCGGGTYTRAWHDLGAAMVLGADCSEPMLDAAREAHAGLPGVDFRQGEATATGLADGCADVVFARALVHHTPDLAAVVVEAHRVLHAGGTYLIQDRTADDVAQPGSATHPRGWLFDVHPRLLEIENGRRPDPAALGTTLTAAGFDRVHATTLWEVRRRYEDREQYLAEIGARTGRSILHELDDAELATLVSELRERLPEGPLTETDRWTIWQATRPA